MVRERTTDDRRSDFFVYGLFSSLGGLFYVGKGTNCRHKQHLRPSSLLRDCPVSKAVKQIYESGETVDARVLVGGLVEDEAYNIERDIIARCGRGLLVNKKTGGNGGCSHSADTIFDISNASKTQWADPEIRKKRIDGLRKTGATAEFRNKIATISKQQWQNSRDFRVSRIRLPSNRIKIAMSCIGRPSHQRKPTVCVETGKSYASRTLAAKSAGVTVGAVSMAIRKGFCAGGLHWRTG